MTAGHVYNHFILHTQQIFTLALMVSVSIDFWKLCYHVKTSTIPTTYREELVLEYLPLACNNTINIWGNDMIYSKILNQN